MLLSLSFQDGLTIQLDSRRFGANTGGESVDALAKKHGGLVAVTPVNPRPASGTVLGEHTFTLNPNANGGEQVVLTTTFLANGEPGAFFWTQQLTLNSYLNSVVFNLQDAIGPDRLRDLANALDRAIQGYQAQLTPDRLRELAASEPVKAVDPFPLLVRHNPTGRYTIVHAPGEVNGITDYTILKTNFTV